MSDQSSDPSITSEPDTSTEPAPGCEGCTRRTVLQGFVAASALVPVACRMDDPVLGGNNPDLPDAAPTDDSVQGTGFEMCGPDLCLDLTHPNNSALATVGGNRVIPITGDRIIVIRTTDTKFDTVSAVCTHSGCTVRYVMNGMLLSCPCHGSAFELDGTRTAGPALRDLRVFQNTFDQGASLLTIML
jgi:cytochrome b6-f complex iron-sulfur subunit